MKSNEADIFVRQAAGLQKYADIKIDWQNSLYSFFCKYELSTVVDVWMDTFTATIYYCWKCKSGRIFTLLVPKIKHYCRKQISFIVFTHGVLDNVCDISHDFGSSNSLAPNKRYVIPWIYDCTFLRIFASSSIGVFSFKPTHLQEAWNIYTLTLANCSSVT